MTNQVELGGQTLAHAMPETFELYDNCPNPFNPTTQSSFALPEATTVQLVIYDALGKEVTRLMEGPYTAGHYAVEWDAHNLPSGTYFYHLKAGPLSKTKTMILIK